MTHTPPVPPGNQSPFPIQEPPHTPTASATAGSATSSSKASTPTPNSSSSKGDEWAEPGKRRWSLGKIIGATAGVGAIAIGVAAVLFPRDTAPEPKKKKQKN